MNLVRAEILRSLSKRSYWIVVALVGLCISLLGYASLDQLIRSGVSTDRVQLSSGIADMLINGAVIVSITCALLIGGDYDSLQYNRLASAGYSTTVIVVAKAVSSVVLCIPCTIWMIATAFGAIGIRLRQSGLGLIADVYPSPIFLVRGACLLLIYYCVVALCVDSIVFVIKNSAFVIVVTLLYILLVEKIVQNSLPEVSKYVNLGLGRSLLGVESHDDISILPWWLGLTVSLSWILLLGGCSWIVMRQRRSLA